MTRATHTFEVNDIELFKQRMLNWADQFNIFLFLDSHSYPDKYSNEEWMLAAGAVEVFSPPDNILEQLDRFACLHQDWLFGHLNYDLKNHIEHLSSSHPDHIGFPDIFLFRPDVLIRKKEKKIEISAVTQEPAKVFAAIQSTIPSFQNNAPLAVSARIPKEEYIALVEQLRKHILRGDCYEINFCQEFFAADVALDPVSLYRKLSALSPTPFGGLYKLDDKYLLCASPERFLQRKGNRLITQPIKGTIGRNHDDISADEQLKTELRASAKDKSENVMIVDLMRNDLSKVCSEGSVRVEELYGIYSFPQVHQMISTVVGELGNEVSLGEVLKATFPMGSMTGAPKIRVMELTERYEKTKRGIYSGSIGYIDPAGDFDFNVVIRSIMYNRSNRYLSYQVGGAITFNSDPQLEYEECLLKAAAIKKVLNNQHLDSIGQ